MAQASSDIIRYRMLIAVQAGADVAAILDTAGAPPGFMESDVRFVDLEFERRVWRAIVAETGREDIGLLCGARFPTQAISMLGFVMANAPTIRAAFEKCCAYQRLIGDSMGMEIEKGERTSIIKIKQLTPWHDELRYTVDFMMAAWQSWSTANAPRPVRPVRVAFHYERPIDVTPYDALFSPAPVRFSAQESSQIFNNEELDQPVIGANREMYSYFEEKTIQALRAHEGRDTLAFRVKGSILEHMKADAPSIDIIASELAMSVRSLQQGLSSEGTKFSTVLQEARCELAKRYLQEKRVGNAEIAYLLGYSEVSVFSRSFKKWTGLTPSDYVASVA